jgi:hypothetical protein
MATAAALTICAVSWIISVLPAPAQAEIHDIAVVSCSKQGPPPINLSDTGGAQMYTSCTVANFSEHEESVEISQQDAILESPVPIGCMVQSALLFPGSRTFLLGAGETITATYRTTWQCHSPAVQMAFPISVTVRARHLGGICVTDTNEANNSFTIMQNGFIGPVTPETTPGPSPTQGPSPSPTPTVPASNGCQDGDGDGFADQVELHVGTGPLAPCGVSGWPADLEDAPPSDNRVDLIDLGSFFAPLQRFNVSPGAPGYNVRWDLSPGAGASSTQLNLQDLGAVLTTTPAMLNGGPALNSECPYP